MNRLARWLEAGSRRVNAWIASASFASWDTYVVERTADGTSVPEDDYLLAFDDPEWSANKTCDEGTGSGADVYTDAMAEADIGATTDVVRAGADNASTN
ncbi:hypothetical protein ZWY2020_025126 [Hordeum vulgare]|nr:hypothetical protein ZWY2020_025126 [Hordeum vulgare]